MADLDIPSSPSLLDHSSDHPGTWNRWASLEAFTSLPLDTTQLAETKAKALSILTAMGLDKIDPPTTQTAALVAWAKLTFQKERFYVRCQHTTFRVKISAAAFEALGYTRGIPFPTRNKSGIKNFQLERFFNQEDSWKTNDGYLIANIIDPEHRAAQEAMMAFLDFTHLKHRIRTSKLFLYAMDQGLQNQIYFNWAKYASE